VDLLLRMPALGREGEAVLEGTHLVIVDRSKVVKM
jgi:hypothetical protein